MNHTQRIISSVGFTKSSLRGRRFIGKFFHRGFSYGLCTKPTIIASARQSSDISGLSISWKDFLGTTTLPRSIQTSPPDLAVEIWTRSLSTTQKIMEKMKEPKLLSDDQLEDFMSAFPTLVKDLVEDPEMKDMEETNWWFSKVLQYNLTQGKLTCGLNTALAYRYMAEDLTDDNVRLSYILGWCLEISKAFFLVYDDIMDVSETRRGKPCWYKVDNLGPAAFNDAILLECGIYSVLKKYFRTKEYYVDLFEIFQDITNKTAYGQSLDIRTGLHRKVNTYTMDRYCLIVKYKTSFCAFSSSVRLAMAMAGMNDAELIRQARTVELEMAYMYQIQDDYIDCFGNVDVTGKKGSDIQNCKCSWLFIVAMQNATLAQQEYLKENYGKDDEECIARVKQLYVELGLPEKYKQYEENTYNMICTKIQQMSSTLPKPLFINMLDNIYNRMR